LLTSSTKTSLPLRRGRVRVGVIVIPENNHPPHSFVLSTIDRTSARRLNPLPSRAGKMDEYKIKKCKINSARINICTARKILV